MDFKTIICSFTGRSRKILKPQQQQIFRAEMNRERWTRKKSSVLILSLVVYCLPQTAAGSNPRTLQIESNAEGLETVIESCFSAIADADARPLDAQLSKTEYVDLLNSLSQDDYQDLDFEQLPLDLKTNYGNFERGDGSFSAFGVRPGEFYFASQEQKQILRNFCLATNEILDGASTEVNSPVPTMTPTSSGPEITSGPTTSGVSCFDAFSEVDKNKDDEMNTTEYITFVNELSTDGFINQTPIEEYTFDALPNSLRDNFFELSGPNNSINITGYKAGSNQSIEQREFLRRVCINTNTALFLSNTTVSPSSIPISNNPPSSFPSILSEVVEIRSRFIISNDAGLLAADFIVDDNDERTKLSFAYNEMTRRAVEEVENQANGNSRRRLRGAERKLRVTHVVDSGRADDFTDTSCPSSVSNERRCQEVNASFKVSITNDEDMITAQKNLMDTVNNDIDSGKLEALLIEQESNINVYSLSDQSPLPDPTFQPIDSPSLTELNIPVSMVISNTLGIDAADLFQGSRYRSNLQKALELMGSSVISEREGSESYVDGSSVITDIFDTDCPGTVSGLCQSVFAFYKLEVDITSIDSVPYLSEIRQDTLEAIEKGLFDEALSNVNKDSDFEVVRGMIPLRPVKPQFDITAEFGISNPIGVKAEDLFEGSLLRSDLEKAFGATCSSVLAQRDGSERFVPRSGIIKDIFDTECPQTVPGVCQSVFAQCTVELTYAEPDSVLAEIRKEILEAIEKGLFDEALKDIDEELQFKVVRGLIPTRPGVAPSQSPLAPGETHSTQNDPNSEGDQNNIAVIVIVPIVVVIIVVCIFVYIIYFRNNSPKVQKLEGNGTEDCYVPTEIQKEQRQDSFLSPRYNHSKPELNPILSQDNSVIQQESNFYHTREGFAMFENSNNPLDAVVETNSSNVVTRDGILSTAGAANHNNGQRYRGFESEGRSSRPPMAYDNIDNINISDSSDSESSSSVSDNSGTYGSEGSDEELNLQFYGGSSNQQQQMLQTTAASAFTPTESAKDKQLLKSNESSSDSYSESDSSSYESSSESDSSSTESYGHESNHGKSREFGEVPDASFFASTSDLRAPSFDNDWPASTFEEDKFNEEANGGGSMHSGFPVGSAGARMAKNSMVANRSLSGSDSESSNSSSAGSDSSQSLSSSSDSSTSSSSSDSDTQMDYIALQSPINNSRDSPSHFGNNTEPVAAALSGSDLESDTNSTSETDSSSDSNSDSLLETDYEKERIEVANRDLSERQTEQIFTDEAFSDLPSAAGAGATVAALSSQRPVEEENSGVGSDSILKGSLESNNETVQTDSYADGSADDGINRTTAATAGAISTLSMWSADESKDDNVVNRDSEASRNKATKVDDASSDTVPGLRTTDGESAAEKGSIYTNAIFSEGSEKHGTEAKVPPDSEPVLKLNANEEALLCMPDTKIEEKSKSEDSSPPETGFGLGTTPVDLVAVSSLDDIDTDQARLSSGQVSCERGEESLVEGESDPVLHDKADQEILVHHPVVGGKPAVFIDQTSKNNDSEKTVENVTDNIQNLAKSTAENDVTRTNSENLDTSAANANGELARSSESEGMDESSITKTDEVHNMFMTRALERACSRHDEIDALQHNSNGSDGNNTDRIARKVDDESSNDFLTTFGESEGTGTQTRVISELSISELSSRGELQSANVASNTSDFVEHSEESERLGRGIENEDNNLLRSALDDDSDSGSDDTEYTDSDDNSYDEETYIQSLGTYEDTMVDMGPEEALAFAMAAAKRIDEQAEADTSTITGGTIPDTDEFEKQIADFQAHDIKGVLKKSDEEKQKQEDFLVGREIDKASNMDTSSEGMNSKDVAQVAPDLETTDESNRHNSSSETSSTDKSDSDSDSNYSDSSDESSSEDSEEDSSEEEPSVLGAQSYYTNGSEGKGLLNDPTQFRRQLQIREDVEELVRELVPEEVENLDAMFVQFSGREEELLNTLKTMRERRAKVRARAAEHKKKARKPRRVRTSQNNGIFVTNGGGGLNRGGANSYSTSSSSGSSSHFAESSGTSSSGGESSRDVRALKSG